MLVLVALLAGSPASSQTAPPGGAPTWKIDPTHSELSFRVRHLMNRVRGTFDDWSGTIMVDPRNLQAGSVSVTVNAASIDTGNKTRDAQLRSADFFDVPHHPTLTFRSRKVEVQGEKVRVTGDLTIRGVTKPVVLDGEYNGTAVDAQGRRKIGFDASTTINRQDFGVSWNEVVEGGGLLLGDQVEISIEVEATQQ